MSGLSDPHVLDETRKKQKLTETVVLCYTETPEDEAAVPRTVVNYLALLFTLMLAYAKAGVERLVDAPAAEPRGTDTTKVVEVPLDVAMRCHQRASLRVAMLPTTSSWLG